jgi:hypothetical protein
MGTFLRNLGIATIAAWAVMLLALEYMGKERFPWHLQVFSAGLVMILLGILLQVMGRAQGAVVRRRCVRCGQRVMQGQIYCSDHFHESVDEARDEQRRGSS